MLETEPGIEVVGEAGDGEAAVAMARALHPDLVLMDLRMPRLDGAGATARIVAESPGTRVLVLTTYDTDADIRVGGEGAGLAVELEAAHEPGPAGR